MRIVQSPALNDGNLNEIVLEVMPSIGETRSAQYNAFSPLHHPGEILKYEHTSARTWSIDAIFISRTREEATRNLKIINTIRTWLMPFYGQGTLAQPATSAYLGAPPPILTITGLGDHVVGPVRCILENYNFSFPTDIDYIPTNDGTPFPVIFKPHMSFKEAWSPAEYSGFDLVQYRSGNLTSSFTAVRADAQINTAAQVYTPVTVNTAEPVTASAAPKTGSLDLSAQEIETQAAARAAFGT